MTDSDPFAAFDWSPLERAGGDLAELPAQFKEMAAAKGLFARTAAISPLVQTLHFRNTRADAAPVALPFLYALAADKAQPCRSLVLQLIAGIGLGVADAAVPQGFNEAAAAANTADTVPYRAYKATEATLPQLLPFLTDSDTAVRAVAAYTASFFPAAREAVAAVLLPQIEAETSSEARCTQVVALAMLYRSEQDAAAREALWTQLAEHRCKAAADGTQALPRPRTPPLTGNAVRVRLAALGADPDADARATMAHVTRWSLRLARGILGIHTTEDVVEMLRVAVGPDMLPIHSTFPGAPEKHLETELPYCDPSLASMTFRIVAQLPGPGPQPKQTCFHLAQKIKMTWPENVHELAAAALRCAFGWSPATGATNRPNPWPAFKQLEDGQGACVVALTVLEKKRTPEIKALLKEWNLPLTNNGLNAYMAGTPVATALAREAKSARGCCG